MTEQTNERYIDPNSGAAPQPGGYAAAVVPTDDSDGGGTPDVDQVYEAEQEHSAGPQGSQPGNPDGDNASESGQTETEESPEGNSDAEAGASDDGSKEETPQTEGSNDEAGDSGDSQEEAEAKDYSELLSGTVPPVQKYLEEHPEEKQAVQDAERARAAEAGTDPRKGITEQ